MSLNEKASGKFGGMIKIKNTKTVGSDSDKASHYDKHYHYPSADGHKVGMDGGAGLSQHVGGQSYHYVSGNGKKSPITNGPANKQHTNVDGIKYFKASEC